MAKLSGLLVSVLGLSDSYFEGGNQLSVYSPRRLPHLNGGKMEPGTEESQK